MAIAKREGSSQQHKGDMGLDEISQEWEDPMHEESTYSKGSQGPTHNTLLQRPRRSSERQ